MTGEMCAELIREALTARRRAYTPYSHYQVGAALLCADGTVVPGCNIENASYGATVCGERTALFAALAQGKRDFVCLALVSGPEETAGPGSGNVPQAAADDGEPRAALPWPSPCGICRQTLREFVNPKEFEIILARSPEVYRVVTLEELLPESFGPEFL